MPSLVVLLATIATAAAAAVRDAPARRAPTEYWYEKMRHNGISPFIDNGANWTVFRNVKDAAFGGVGDGVSDDTAAIQKALNWGNGTASRDSHSFGTTGQPAVVYIPGGTYLITSPIQSYVGNVIMGDPLNPPVLKAAPNFSGDFLWYAKDPNFDSTINFYIGMKNLVLDSTLMPPAKQFTLMDWSVSQNVQLTNVLFDMPPGSTGHTGLSMPEGGSPLMMNDLVFQGGAVGIRMNEQQYHLKGITFRNQDTGLLLEKLFEGVGQGLRFESCRVGIDSTNNNTGFFALIDSSATNTQILWNAADSPTAQGSLVVENVIVDSSVGSTVTAGNKSVLTGSVLPGKSWIWGNVYSSKDNTRAQGKIFDSARAASLVDGAGAYHTVKPPTFQEYSHCQVVNVKNVPGWPVTGDGKTDDTKSLQHIIDATAGKKVLFFPHGTYLVSDTLKIPSGTKFHGEVWSEISAIGSKFADEHKPTPLVQVGQPGDVGVAQFVDMLFTVADILPGCNLVEVNMAGSAPGDVGFWNTHFRIGGARGSKVQANCGDPATCKAARLCAHLTKSSSSYWENSWCWTADHDLDDTFSQNPSVAGGFLVEAEKATWLLGIGSEHNVLYQINIDSAKNVFLGFQQSETPYWQGVGSDLLAPAPWAASLLPSDPDFSWCAADDAQCRMAMNQRIAHSEGVSAYGAGFWTFFNGYARNGCSSECQENAVLYEDNIGLHSFGISTHNVRTMILEGRNGSYKALTDDTANSGGWQSGGGVVAAYLPSL